MKTENYFTLKEFQLNNNCPECYSNYGLQLTFKQKISDTIFLKAVTSKTINKMHCNNCNTNIYPICWDSDIERVVAYHQRAVVTKRNLWKLKPLAYVFIAVDILIILAIVLIMTDAIRL
ncbi:hypothetical protein [Winogradskyella sp.]|uniref:hypothetical protein n=1 Tax=Winogradskyella sp. TaxID=1883156 RepID=UPI0025D69970|nr:hypothetical protein [Winogradskyella sp.]MBT8245604.1 hypothetical protein [Winogradskyella sp.]